MVLVGHCTWNDWACAILAARWSINAGHHQRVSLFITAGPPLGLSTTDAASRRGRAASQVRRGQMGNGVSGGRGPGLSGIPGILLYWLPTPMACLQLGMDTEVLPRSYGFGQGDFTVYCNFAPLRSVSSATFLTPNGIN